MNLWIRTTKRFLLSLLAVGLAFGWARTGHTQAPCLVERGQDPLDVANSGIRHNVWLVLDTSASMNASLVSGGPSKLQIAKTEINQLMDRLVDSAGRPLVNWGFAHFDPTVTAASRCTTPDAPDDLDTFPDKPRGCVGLRDRSFVNPAPCGGDSRNDVRSILDSANAVGFTPVGVSFTDIAEYLVGRHRPDDTSVVANTTDFVQGLLPNQKNFIIQITDGLDTCDCDLGGYPAIATDPLVNPVTIRPDKFDPLVTRSSSGGSDLASFNAGLKGEVALRAIDPSLDGSKGNIFVVGFDVENDPTVSQGVSTIAWMASGARISGRDPDLLNPPVFANNPGELFERLNDILAKISIPASELTLSQPIVGSIPEVIPVATNTTVSPAEVHPPAGATASQIRSARIVRADHRNNVLLTTFLDLPGFRGHLRATNIYRVTDPQLPRSQREADFTELWDAGLELQDDDPDLRNLVFNRRGSNGLLSFTVNNVTPQDLGVAAGFLRELDGTGALSEDDARDIVVQVIRGYRISVDSVTGTIYDSSGDLNFSKLDANGDPNWKLFESTAGAVAVVGPPPRSPDFNPPLNHSSEYGVGGTVPGDGFFWDHFNRGTAVVYQSNAGITHVFDGASGAEIVGYLPDDVLGLAPGEVPGSRDTLRDFVRLLATGNNGIVNHKFTLSGPPIVNDVFLRSDRGGDDDWHTVVVFGRGRGGRFLTALDLTDPASPELLWNRGNREGIVEGPIDGLGETWSTPVLGNVDTRTGSSTQDNRVDQWLVFAGAGYGCVNAADEGHFLYAFRVEDGSIHFQAQVTNDASAPIAHNALVARPTLYNPHQEDSSDNQDFVTRVYMPDVQGNVWKLDTSDVDPGQWTFRVFAETGAEHPITAPVTILRDTFQPNRIFVMVGSGGDQRVDVPAGGFRFRVYLDEDAEGENTTQHGGGGTPLFERTFEPEERMFAQAVTVGRIGDAAPPVVFFASSREEFDPAACELQFFSTAYAVGVLSGLPEFDLDPNQTGEDSASLGEGKVEGLFVRDGNVYISESGGLGRTGSIGVWGANTFDDEPSASSFGIFTIQILVDGFRISPF